MEDVRYEAYIAISTWDTNRKLTNVCQFPKKHFWVLRQNFWILKNYKNFKFGVKSKFLFFNESG